MMATYDAYVEGFAVGTAKESLKRLFSEFGVVKGVWLPSNSSSSERSAFVKFATPDALESAVMEMNGYLFHGCKLTISFARKKKSHSYTKDRHSSPARENTQQKSIKSPWRHKELSPGATTPPISPFSSENKSSRKACLIVTHVESSFEFWGQFDEASGDLVDLTGSLNDYCDSNPPVCSETVNSSEVYGSLFAADSTWYRCQIVHKISPDEAVIRYIDYGNTETVPMKSLLPLPGHLKVPCYSFKFLISNLQQESRQLKDPAELVELLLDQCVEATIWNDVTMGTYKVDPVVTLLSGLNNDCVKRSEVDLGKVMLKSCDGGSPPLFQAPDLQTLNHYNIQTPESSPEKSLPPLTNSFREAPFSEAPSKIVSLEEENAELKASLEQVAATHSDQLRQLSDDHTEQLQQLNEEHSDHIEQLNNDHSQALVSAIEISMQVQINRMVDKVQCLKQCRGVTQIGMPPCLEVAIELVLAEDGKVVLSGVYDVENAAEVFESAQKAIRDCSKKSDLEQLVLTRDSARIELSDAINAFLVHTQKKLNIQSRESAVMSAFDALERMFPDQSAPVNGGGGKGVEVGNAVDSYRTWLENIMMSYEKCVERCVSTWQALQSGLKTLNQCFCLDEVSDEPPAPDVSKLLCAYNSAIDDEIETRKQFGDNYLLEAEETRSLSSNLLAALKQEQKDILTLRDRLDQYTQLQLAVDQWLVARPDVTPVQVCRQTMRRLRIEFGHKMVERKELIQDGDVEELKLIEEQLSEIRKNLHMAFIQESNEMENLSTMLDQFPELPILHPQLHLQDFVASGGLLKTGRSIEHFERLEQLENVDMPAFRSMFNNQPCVIKEFNLTAPGVLDTLVSNAKLLNTVQNPAVVSVRSIFRDETNKAYVQLADYGSVCMIDWIKAKPDEMVVRQVCHRVLEALMALHAAGVVYGSLKASSVWLDTPEQGPPTPILTDFCLDQDLSSHCKVLPESTAAFDTHSDMYLFGQFLLWTVHPEATLVHDPEGNPRLTKFSLPLDFHSLLEGLLHASPKLRLAAATAITHPFFGPPSDSAELNDCNKKEDLQLLPYVADSLADDGLPSLTSSDTED